MVDSAVVLVVAGMNMFALVGYKAYELVDVDGTFDGVVSQDLLKFSLLLAESVYMQDQNLRPIYHRRYFHTFLRAALLALVVLI